MSLPAHTSFQEELERTLGEAGLPKDPKQIISRFYQFECEHGSHHHILVGTVTAIEVSDEANLLVFVSSPLFWGDRLRCFMHTNDVWYVRAVSPDDEISNFEGSFKLI